MDELLSDDVESDNDEINDDSEIKFKHLKINIPGAKLKNVSRAVQKIDCLKQLDLSADVLGITADVIELDNDAEDKAILTDELYEKSA